MQALANSQAKAAVLRSPTSHSGDIGALGAANDQAAVQVQLNKISAKLDKSSADQSKMMKILQTSLEKLIICSSKSTDAITRMSNSMHKDMD